MYVCERGRESETGGASKQTTSAARAVLGPAHSRASTQVSTTSSTARSTFSSRPPPHCTHNIASSPPPISHLPAPTISRRPPQPPFSPASASAQPAISHLRAHRRLSRCRTRARRRPAQRRAQQPCPEPRNPRP
eukprot:2163032-Rhodomonas_salina.1